MVLERHAHNLAEFVLHKGDVAEDKTYQTDNVQPSDHFSRTRSIKTLGHILEAVLASELNGPNDYHAGVERENGAKYYEYWSQNVAILHNRVSERDNACAQSGCYQTEYGASRTS